MNVSKEFLLEAVGLSLLVALLLAGVRIFHRTSAFISAVEREQEQKIQELEEYEIVQFDGITVDGITVISYIKNVVSQYEIPVYVETKNNSFMITKKEEYSNLRDMTSTYYVDSFAVYRCEVVRNENDSIERVEIRMEREENENE